MKVHAKMEAYLSQLEQALGPIPISDKAEIVMEIKSHIMSAIENNPETNIDEVLSSLGAPEHVANRYLLERGLKPVRPPRTPVLKWLVLGFLGTGVLFIAFIAILFMSFTPLIEVDEKNGHVSILGGAIDINELDGTVHIGSSVVKNGFEESKHEGRMNLQNSKAESLAIDFTNGKIRLENSDSEVLKWRCKTSNLGQQNLVEEGEQLIRFNLQQASGADCKIEVPSKLKVKLAGPNGRLKLKRPLFEVDAKITNGSVIFRPSEEKKYRFDLSVVNGLIDEVESSPEPDAIPIKIALVNGKIDVHK